MLKYNWRIGWIKIYSCKYKKQGAWTWEYNFKNLFKFLIPSLFGLLLFVIPLPYGKLFKLDGLSPINIGIGFLAELIKIIAADYLINMADI